MKIKKKQAVITLSSFLLILAGVTFAYYWNLPTHEITRAKLEQIIQSKQVVKGTVIPSSYAGFYTVQGEFRETQDSKLQSFKVTTHLDESQLKTLFAVSGISIDTSGSNSKTQWINLISTILVSILVITVVLYQTNIGKTKTLNQIRERPNVRFVDVAGVEEAKEEVSEIVDYLKDPEKYKRLGAHIPKGVLLIGPPGTGKTMLAKAIAGEAKALFFSAHGSDFNEVFVGVGARRVRELFKQAKKAKPAIIFIDEIDCLGKNRKTDTHAELQQTNNALLAAMDGFENSEGIVVIAATNRPEDLDEALQRPGRFDRKVLVPYPDMKGRRAILETHRRNKPIENSESVLDVIAQTTPGMSGADLANLLNEAALLSAQQNMDSITITELEESRDKVRFGKERKSMVVKSDERELVAYHEAGHAIINLRKTLLPTLYKVSIIPRGSALGVTTLLPDEDQNIHRKDFLLEELVVLMGGRAAERTFYGVTTNGAHGDLDTAKKIARRMVCDWGMGEKLYYEADHDQAESEINRLLENADHEAFALIQEQKENTKKLAQALLKRETLTRAEVVDLLYPEGLKVAA
jgi:cell division protease FtsH